jgi:uracil DNA glycosylase
MWGSKPAALTPLIQNAATAAGGWNTRVKVVTAPHPATANHLSGTNTFKRINDALVSIGGAPLNW